MTVKWILLIEDDADLACFRLAPGEVGATFELVLPAIAGPAQRRN